MAMTMMVMMMMIVPMKRNHINEVWRAHMYPFMLRARQQLNLSIYDTRTKSRSVALTVTVLKNADQPLQKG